VTKSVRAEAGIGESISISRACHFIDHGPLQRLVRRTSPKPLRHPAAVTSIEHGLDRRATAASKDRQLRGEPSNGAIFVGAAQFAGPTDPRVAMLLHEDRDVVDHR
jgi:hypothetical protein